MNMLKKHYANILAAWIAFVFIQSLFFKFSGSYETQHIFGTLGEWAGLPWFAEYGGITIGIVELIASLLLFSKWRSWGAVLAFGVISGAIIFHVFTPPWYCNACF
ncbi:DoxX-like family protein [Alteromonadaceae bacterium Bs31]|nr:DoxX-like family protein [Alteromonadaceae bacterium Bs31]